MPVTHKPVYSLEEVVIAAAMASDVTMKDAAEHLEISEKWLYEHKRGEDALGRIEPLAEQLKGLMKVSGRALRQVALENAMTELEKRLGKSFQTLDDALEDGDMVTAYHAGKEIRDRLMGKAASTVNVNQSGKIDLIHRVAPREALDAMDEDSILDRPFHKKVRQILQIEAKPSVLQGEVTDTELVELN